MAPIKFEEHVREQLEKREIQPSAGSWDKLSSRLGETENRPRRKWWISAAAAVIVLVVASLIFIDQQKGIEAPIVENPAEMKKSEPQNPENFEKADRIASEENSDVIQEKTEEVKPQEIVETGRAKEKIQNDSNESQLAQNSSKDRVLIEPIRITPPVRDAENPTQFSQQINELLAKVAQKEEQNGDVTEAEVNRLLAEAAREISQSGKYTEGDVSAEALLADVEFEMDQSFRQEVFEVLKEGFLKARTAIATRNE
ncbi:hypothetical protein NE848_00580 [Gramella jeungdoensis]|uniref:Anti-sigma factor n=1 Tax=Gramella jeungdoensis TaxID=708091 RepID=A0ABT0YWN3_9FLAO|nr:hypothetical protein [Gramella jeungdoensis]MCM8567859.1 hypothetical protein [Gramella jeungdoensis]